MPESSKFTIYTDGAARGNPGASASGFIILKEGKIISKNEIYNGIATNNYAEYNAILNALEWCKANIKGADSPKLEVYSDSELVVKQLNGEYKVKDQKLKSLNAKVKTLSEEFAEVQFHNVRRENPWISAVDKSINKFLDEIVEKNNSKRKII
ncbi:MAG: ribonuclease HI family protein [Candidatus Micrarchaeia archaeon]